MHQETEKNFNEYIKSVPQELRDAILSSRWEEKLIAIGRRNGVHIDQLGMLQDELAFVMGGVSSREEFRSNLVNHLNLRDTEADAVIADINKNVMSDIQARLKRNIEEVDRREQEEEARSQLMEHGVEIHSDESDSVSVSSNKIPQIKIAPPPKPTEEMMKKFAEPFTLRSLVKQQLSDQGQASSKSANESGDTGAPKHHDPYREPI